MRTDAFSCHIFFKNRAIGNKYSDMKTVPKFVPVTASDGHVFANFAEDAIFGKTLWLEEGTSLLQNRLKEITDKRRDEIIKAYKDKYHIK